MLPPRETPRRLATHLRWHQASHGPTSPRAAARRQAPREEPEVASLAAMDRASVVARVAVSVALEELRAANWKQSTPPSVREAGRRTARWPCLEPLFPCNPAPSSTCLPAIRRLRAPNPAGRRYRRISRRQCENTLRPWVPADMAVPVPGAQAFRRFRLLALRTVARPVARAWRQARGMDPARTHNQHPHSSHRRGRERLAAYDQSR